jgi:formyl-CoA transferase
VRFSRTPHSITQGGPCIGEHTEEVLTSLLGLSTEEVTTLREEGVV